MTFSLVKDTEPIGTLAVSPCSKHLLVFSGSLALRIFTLPAFQPSQAKAGVKNVVHPNRVISKAHEAPIHVSTVDPTSTYLASGSADGVVKVWDIHRGYITHVFKGHGGVVSALAFNYPETPPQSLQLTPRCSSSLDLSTQRYGYSTWCCCREDERPPKTRSCP